MAGAAWVQALDRAKKTAMVVDDVKKVRTRTASRARLVGQQRDALVWHVALHAMPNPRLALASFHSPVSSTCWERADHTGSAFRQHTSAFQQCDSGGHGWTVMLARGGLACQGAH